MKRCGIDLKGRKTSEQISEGRTYQSGLVWAARWANRSENLHPERL